MTAERLRLEEAREHKAPWKMWGPYLSERQWGTVREDTSEDGDAWNSFTHDMARSRAYRWGEDGIAGICDDRQRLCFALTLWNGNDPILKERLFGLTNSESNHGEDVKEYYFYLDNTPTHTYMKALYKYPQQAFPYDDLVTTSKSLTRHDFEYELLDTKIFDEHRYFDVFIEYAKDSPEDILIRITAINRGPDAAELHLLPTLWFRNRWSWTVGALRPSLTKADGFVVAVDPKLGTRCFYIEPGTPLLFTENETNHERIHGSPNQTPYVKDSFHRLLIGGEADAVNPAGTGTKVAAHHTMMLGPGESRTIKLRLSDLDPASLPTDGGPPSPLGDRFDKIFAERIREADEFYATVIPPAIDPEGVMIMRQALAGMLWTKQFYHYDVDKWLEERGHNPYKSKRAPIRNEGWHHMYNGDVISMPDKWEYPWYAAWDLAFHVTALQLVDPDFAKDQLKLMLREHYMHPNGQIPAYEWNFGDVNPPVHAWATIFTYRLGRGQRYLQSDSKNQKRDADLEWLKSSFQKLLLNFTWWVNRKDRTGRNVFEGGFLGLDNIGVFDRSSPLPTGGCLEQADGTAWMALYCQNMLDIAIELSMTDDDYSEMAIKFTEHFLWIASAMTHLGDDTGMWDEADGFFYDVLRFEDGKAQRLKVRSIVGLLPLCAATFYEEWMFKRHPELWERFAWFLEARPGLCASIHDPRKPGHSNRRLAAILDETKLRRVLEKLLDEDEFLGEYGIRSLSKYHEANPFEMEAAGQKYTVAYLPAESDSGMFGGNSNWRGPIWMPINALIIRALFHYYAYYGNDLKVECPMGSGILKNLYEVAEEITRRLTKIFRKDASGKRPVFGGAKMFQKDPHWRDNLLFYEYFHGDNGAGLGASHQTGWTGVIARLMHVFATMTEEDMLESGKLGYAKRAAGDTIGE